MKPAVSYQGSKIRLVKKIGEKLQPFMYIKPNMFDMCCGSGAISLFVVSRGWYSPQRITMIDAGPWGEVWQLIGRGEFDLDCFKWWCDRIPRDKAKIFDFMVELSGHDATIDTPYVYLLLQAASFGGRAVWREGVKWKTHSFRRYWTPTETSKKRVPVDPMMPMPEVIFERMASICQTMDGVDGIHGAVEDCEPQDALVYIDPPYSETKGYGVQIEDLESICLSWSTNNIVFVSEGRPIGENANLISGSRGDGWVSIDGKSNEEWLSFFGDPVHARNFMKSPLGL